jgi:type IX secretion system substrate protein
MKNGIIWFFNSPLTPGDNISLFPNPASDECTIHSDAAFSLNARADIYDLAGRLIAKYPLSGHGAVVPLTGVAPGMYQCRVYTEGAGVLTKKLVVVKR